MEPWSSPAMTFFQRLLDHLQLTETDYHALTAEVTVNDLVRLDSFDDHEKLISIIHQHIAAQHPIKIYGDYDADGMVATTIMMALFRDLDYPHVSYQLPIRYQDGYGIKIQHAKQCVEAGIKLIILVDNGVSAHEALAYFHQHDVDVIIIDHHTITTLPTTMQAMVHAEYQTKHPLPRCAGYLAYMVYHAILKQDHPYLLALAAIATITDAMPLIQDNRSLVKLGLKMMNDHRFPTLTPLVKTYPADEETIAMAVGPVFNAIGRMVDNQDIQRIVAYLLLDNLPMIQAQASWLIAVNESRKISTLTAAESIEHSNQPVSFHVIDERSGLTGLIASRLLQHPKKIIGVFAEDHQDAQHYVGSIRADVDIPVLTWVQHYQGLIIAYGGHAQAVGLTINKTEIKKLESYLADCYNHEKIEKTQPRLLHLKLADLSFSNLTFLNALKPFGSGFPSPMMVLKDVPTNLINFSHKPPHYLTTSLSPQSSLFSFKVTQKDLPKTFAVDLVGKMKENRFKDLIKVQFVVDKIIEQS